MTPLLLWNQKMKQQQLPCPVIYQIVETTLFDPNPSLMLLLLSLHGWQPRAKLTTVAASSARQDCHYYYYCYYSKQQRRQQQRVRHSYQSASSKATPRAATSPIRPDAFGISTFPS